MVTTPYPRRGGDPVTRNGHARGGGVRWRVTYRPANRPIRATALRIPAVKRTPRSSHTIHNRQLGGEDHLVGRGTPVNGWIAHPLGVLGAETYRSRLPLAYMPHLPVYSTGPVAEEPSSAFKLIRASLDGIGYGVTCRCNRISASGSTAPSLCSKL